MEVEKMEMGKMWVNAKGCCLDSDLCPQRVTDGALVLMHRININEDEILLHIGGLIAFKFKGHYLVKYLRFVDFAINHIIIVKQFNPEKEIIIPIRDIDFMWHIDEIVK